MATELEKQMLTLLKDTYAHFTRDSLPIAREIINIEEKIMGPQKKGPGDKPTLSTKSESRKEDPPMGEKPKELEKKPVLPELSDEEDDLPF